MTMKTFEIPTDDIALPKPAYGSPCNGCGLCCLAEPCALGAAVFERSEGRCPALEKVQDRYVCGLMVNPAKYVANVDNVTHGAATSVLIGAGLGCDCEDQADNHLTNPTFYRRVLAYRNNMAFSLALSLAVWQCEPDLDPESPNMIKRSA